VDKLTGSRSHRVRKCGFGAAVAARLGNLAKLRNVCHQADVCSNIEDPVFGIWFGIFCFFVPMGPGPI